MFLTQSRKYSDSNLPRDLAYGAGATGIVDPTNSLAPRETLASTDLGSVYHSLRKRDESTVNDLMKAKDTTLKQE